MRKLASRNLTSSELAVYQALVARGMHPADAVEDALDGVDLETARRWGVLHGSPAKPPTDQEIAQALDSIRTSIQTIRESSPS